MCDVRPAPRVKRYIRASDAEIGSAPESQGRTVVWDSFWDFLWSTILVFAFIAYLIILWHIIVDLFRDRDTSGWKKAIWVVFLIIFPYLTSIVYLIGRGKGMTERQIAAAERPRRRAMTTSVRWPGRARPSRSPPQRACSTPARSPRRSSKRSRPKHSRPDLAAIADKRWWSQDVTTTVCPVLPNAICARCGPAAVRAAGRK